MHYQKDIEKLDRKNSYAKPCHKQLKDGKYSNNVQNCDHSDLFGSNVNHEQDNLHDSRTHNENNVTCHLPLLYITQTTILTNHCCVHVAIKLIYQDHNVSSSKNQSTT